MEHGISQSLLELLTRQDKRRQAVGAASLHGIKAPGAADKARTGEVVADAMGRNPAPAYELRKGEERSPILIWNNPNMTSAAVRRTSRAALAIVGI